MRCSVALHAAKARLSAMTSSKICTVRYTGRTLAAQEVRHFVSQTCCRLPQGRASSKSAQSAFDHLADQGMDSEMSKVLTKLQVAKRNVEKVASSKQKRTIHRLELDMEYLAARNRGIPVLTEFKRMRAPRTAEERTAFLRQIELLHATYEVELAAKWRSVPPTLFAPLDEVGILARIGRLITFVHGCLFRIQWILMTSCHAWLVRAR